MHCPCNLSPYAMHLGQVGGGWTPQNRPRAPPTARQLHLCRAGVTYLHTGHLQVPLSQFSCRYDSKSKHCRSQETKTDEPRALRNHLYATGNASGTLMMSHQGGRQVMERPGAGGLGGALILPISCCAYSLWATLSPCNPMPSPPHTSPVHQITHSL